MESIWSSGVEERPGRKSRPGLERLFAEIRPLRGPNRTRRGERAFPRAGGGGAVVNDRREERYFGEFGGRYIPKNTAPRLLRAGVGVESARSDPAFWAEYERFGAEYRRKADPPRVRPNLTKRFGGPRLYLKHEGLAHTGAHKINNALGQALLAGRMGKKRLIAETGAGQHGLATAAVAARLGFECEIFMGEVDMARQHPNVFGMRNFGATVTGVREGGRTLTDAVNAAFKNWTERADDTHYLLGSALGPTPSPPWSGSSRASSARRPGGRFSRPRTGCPIGSMPVWGAAPTQ